MTELTGYVRPDGNTGFRNYVLIIPSIVCANRTVQMAASMCPGAIPLFHPFGCGQLGKDAEQTFSTLQGAGKNPNVYACVVVGLGCEQVAAEEVAALIARSGKQVKTVIIQKEGGVLNAAQAAARHAAQFIQEASRVKRVPVDFDSFVVGLECGGSDATSGIASNPVVGYAVDTLILRGATVILSESAEIIGAEHLLAERAVSKEVASLIYKCVAKVQEQARQMGADLRGSQPSPGNMAGGVTTIEEKSLGCVKKAGNAPIRGVLEYSEAPDGPGLYMMDTPGQDVESMTGMAAAGANLIVFTTGRGTPTGCAMAPVLKVCANPETCRLMRDHIDFDATGVILGSESIAQVGDRLLSHIVAVAGGRLTASEIFGQWDFAINRIGPTV